MVSKKTIQKQLKQIDFNVNGWGRGEVGELAHIILPEEEIYECVNGMYEGGFALLVATDVRVLLVDKKPLNFLTVEDMRFDMISEIDYNHRLFGADISISSGNKLLKFRSYNQQRLRKLIGHVQHCMAEAKKKQNSHQDSQVSHLEQINKQLQAYLIAQHQYQLQLRQAGANDNVINAQVPVPPKPSHELSDYLYAQSLLEQYSKNTSSSGMAAIGNPNNGVNIPSDNNEGKKYSGMPAEFDLSAQDSQDVYDEGVKEIFGKQLKAEGNAQPISFHDSYLNSKSGTEGSAMIHNFHVPYDLNPLHIAYSKLPELLKNRRFARVAMARPAYPDSIP